jgi:Zn-dependent protease
MLSQLLYGQLDLPTLLFWLVGLIIAISFHEAAHAYVADWLGDKTPRYMGRLTLDPLAHLDPVGTLLIILVGFGWGRPVQFNPLALKSPTLGTSLISIAGPITNFILAIIFSQLVRFHVAPTHLWYEIVYINVILGVFNLIPIAPLDGEKIVAGFLPPTMREQWRYLQHYGIFILLIAILTLGAPLSALTSTIVNVLIGQI